MSTGPRGRRYSCERERIEAIQEKAVDGEPRREPMIHVDLDHPRISRAEGEPVFLPHGGNSISGRMYTAFAESGLIEPVAVEVHLMLHRWGIVSRLIESSTADWPRTKRPRAPDGPERARPVRWRGSRRIPAS